MWSETKQRLRRAIQQTTVWLSSLDLQTTIPKYIEDHPALQSVPYWMAAGVVGLIAVLYANAFYYFTTVAQKLLEVHPFLLFIVSPTCFALSWWMVDSFGKKAGGSGIPQVMAGILWEGSTKSGIFGALLGVKTAFIKILSSLVCVLGGGAIGREGPTIQVAASIFHVVGNYSKRFWPRIGHQPWIIAGGAAGLAAAFNTPLGGIVFAIEELAPQYFNRFKTVLISAVIIAGMVAQGIWGPYLYFGFPRVDAVSGSFVPWSVVLGILCGLGGGYFGKALLVGSKKVRRLVPTHRIWFAMACGLVVAVMAYFISPHILGGGSEMVRTLLFSQEHASLELVIGRFVGTVFTYLIGGAGGIFAPSLAMGGAMGSWLEYMADTGNANLMILLGMAGFLAAVTRAPFTALVLVFEMTDRHSAIFHLMVTSVTAYAIAHLIDPKSFYDHMTSELMEELKNEGKAPEPTVPAVPPPPLPLKIPPVIPGDENYS